MTTTQATDPVKVEADAIRASLDRRVKDIASNRDLTAEARIRMATDEHVDAKQKMDDLRQRVASERDRKQKAAASRLLGGATRLSGADAISMRDATERAERLEGAADARKLLDRARSNGDETLVRAIVFEARERSRSGFTGAAWARLLDEESREDSALASDIREMGAGQGGSIESAVRFMLPSLSDVRFLVGERR